MSCERPNVNATAADHAWMAHALRLAARGLLTTTPNPRVGCVLVQGAEMVGEGWHVRAGEPHAEVNALRMAGQRALGATAYVTLEPCSHHGRTPPCADALIGAGIARVVMAMTDPNPQVAGQGSRRLREAGIEVVEGVMQAEALTLNAGFVSRMLHRRPRVLVKLGASLDGRTALANGQSQWITGPAARRDVQRWRARACAMLTSGATVTADNARLTVRDFEVERQPLRVVLDTSLRIAANAAMLQSAGVLLVHGPVPETQRAALVSAGAELWQAPLQEERIDLLALLHELARRGINDVMVEAGPTLCGALLQAGLVDEILLYRAAVVLGSEGRGLFDGLQLQSLDDATRWRQIECRALGSDWRLRYIKNST